MNQQKRLAIQRREIFERLDFFAASGGKRGFVLQKKRNVRTERSRNFIEFFRRKRLFKKFVEREQGRRRIAAAAAKPGGQGNSFPQINCYAIADFRRREEVFRRTENQIF